LFPDSLLRVCRGLCNFGFGFSFGKLLGFVLIGVPYEVLGQQERLTTRRTEETMHEHNLHGFVFGYYYVFLIKKEILAVAARESYVMLAAKQLFRYRPRL